MTQVYVVSTFIRGDPSYIKGVYMSHESAIQGVIDDIVEMIRDIDELESDDKVQLPCESFPYSTGYIKQCLLKSDTFKATQFDIPYFINKTTLYK